MELRDALTQISEIRQQMTRSEVYRGYRSLTTGVSGMLAILGAVIQPLFIASPDSELGRYLIFWIGIAAVSAIVVGSEVWWRARTADSEVLQQMTRLAVEQLSPSLVVGALLTLCVFQTAPQVSWMLPGLWSLIFTRISDWLWYFCPCDQSSRLDFRGFLERNQATEGDTQWVNYSTRRFSSRSMVF